VVEGSKKTSTTKRKWKGESISNISRRLKFIIIYLCGFLIGEIVIKIKKYFFEELHYVLHGKYIVLRCHNAVNHPILLFPVLLF
jgi:hypothetical protein